ncbi:MAG: membrane dipeptidase [Gammaproteobacteria bacterium]|nr:membrane dipeptidase [Gammaproteobacteria bacterium]
MGRITLENRDLSARARQLFEKALVWDDHGCMPLRADDDSFLPQLERYQRAGVDIISLNVGFDAVPWENTVLVLAHFRRWIRQHPDEYLLIEHIDDIDRVRREGKLRVMFDIEGGCALNGQLSMVEFYYDLGVRWMLFAYNRNNALGGGCQDDDSGLTAFGRQVLEEMARVGMVTCCSHIGHRTAMEIIERTSNPVIFSHSNPRALRDHPRNIRDEAIRACAGTGGVIAINGIGNFLGHNDDRTETIVRHIDYVSQLVGADHVGLGLDYVFDQQELADFLKNHPEIYPPEQYPGGMKMVRPEQIPEIAESLLQLGYRDDDLRKILGENHLRIAQQVWKQ